MPCIDEDHALALVQGGEVEPDVRAHVAACDSCRAFVAGLARVMVPEQTTSIGGWGLADGQLEPGTRLGEYTVQSVLGRGGMGVVYAGHDERLERPVAIKVLREDAGERRVSWLRREAAAMARLSHPNVAAVFDFGQTTLGPFVVMELIHGETLAAWASGSPPAQAVLEAYVQAGRGLAAAHDAGVVHRDFKPSNAMIVEEGDVGRVKVLDFGLAAALDVGVPSRSGAAGSSTLGGLGGTPRYAAPEQLAGEPATTRSDQFSFCVALFEALSGALPFAGETSSERRTAMLAGQMRALPSAAPRPVAAALARGLRADPRRRFGSMDALLGSLCRRRSRLGISLGGAGAVALAVWGAWPHSEPPCADGVQRMQKAWPRARSSGWTERPELIAQAERLDTYVEAWLSARSRLCERRAEEPARYERAAACLERLASRVQAAGDRLRSLGDTPLPSNLLGDLDPPEGCSDDAAGGRVVELLRDEYEEIYAWSVRFEADGELSSEERQRIEARAAALQVRARELGDPRVQGQLAHMLGVLAIRARDFSRAEERFLEGFFVAGLSDDASTQLDLAENLVRLFSEYLSEGERALYWAQKAVEVAERIGTDPARGRAALLRATALVAMRKPEASLAAFDQAEALLDGSERMPNLLNRRAAARAQLQHFDEARADLNESIRIIETRLGANHPDLAAPMNTLASLEIIARNFEEAMALFERVLSLIPAEDRLRRAFVRGNLATLLERTGEHERALVMFEDIADTFEASFGLEHEQTVRTKLGIVEVLIALGRTDEAREEVERLMARGLPDSFLSRALLAHASVVEDPRPDLERILTLPDQAESTLKVAREALAELDSAG